MLSQRSINCSSKTLFVDEANISRVGGRLKNADVNPDTKHQVILSRHHHLTLSRRRPLPYRNQSIDLRSKSVDWFLYDNGLRLERVNISDIYYKNAHIRKEHTLYLMKNKYLLVMVLLEKFFQTVFTLKS